MIRYVVSGVIDATQTIYYTQMYVVLHHALSNVNHNLVKHFSPWPSLRSLSYTPAPVE